MSWARRGAWMLAGSVLVAAALELFMIPNQIIDGGVVGLAIMGAHMTALPFGVLVLLLNLPFLWMGYKQIGRTFALSTLAAVALMSLIATLLHGRPLLTEDLLLAALFGGAILGTGVGLILRSGGSLDGTEIIAMVFNRKLPLSVGETVMFMNLFILGLSGFMFGWDRAMYSLLAYFVAFKAIDLTMTGLDQSKSATVITSETEPMREALVQRLGRGVTELEGWGGYTGDAKGVLLCVVTRLEVAKLRSIVEEVDPDAFVAIQDVHEVLGGRFRKRPIH